MNFKEYYFLKEMPYYETEENSIYDMELELYASDLEGFKNKLLRILRGEKLVDKRGISIQLSTQDQLKSFLEWLSSDIQILVFLKMRHKISDVASFIDDIVNEI